MKWESNLYQALCSYENLEKAFEKAKRRKSSKSYVISFEDHLVENLLTLRIELLFHTYKPKPLKSFILRDTKTRRISKSDFRDRIVHHALCNIIEPIFDKTFIYDSYATRKGKGVHKAIQRFDYFKRKVSRNNTRTCYILKADIRHYFDEVDRRILVQIMRKRISDERIIWLIRQILNNFGNWAKKVGMPLGNLTSQFFANIYLNELDYFVKHKLRVKYYIRYVDDFVILHHDLNALQDYKESIDKFLKEKLSIGLHPGKSRIIPLHRGITFLGYRIFCYHTLLRKGNVKRFLVRLEDRSTSLDEGLVTFKDIMHGLNGWFGYAMWANTHNLRKKIMQDVSKLEQNIGTI